MELESIPEKMTMVKNNENTDIQKLLEMLIQSDEEIR